MESGSNIIERVNTANNTLRDMKKFGENEQAVSPVIGTIMMVGFSVIMISAVAVSVFAFTLPESAPQAKIVIA